FLFYIYLFFFYSWVRSTVQRLVADTQQKQKRVMIDQPLVFLRRSVTQASSKFQQQLSNWHAHQVSKGESSGRTPLGCFEFIWTGPKRRYLS
ncbi:hypothetical protein BDV28DRAFT_144513, partial [Aspergillus coremiiformis]